MGLPVTRTFPLQRHRRREPGAHAARCTTLHLLRDSGIVAPLPLTSTQCCMTHQCPPLPDLCVQCPHKVHLLHQVAVFVGSAPRKRPVRQRGGLAATCGWFQEDDGRSGYPTRSRRPSERKAAREDAHDPAEAWRPGVRPATLVVGHLEKKRDTQGLATHRRRPGAVFKCWAVGEVVRESMWRSGRRGSPRRLSRQNTIEPTVHALHTYITVPTRTHRKPTSCRLSAAVLFALNKWMLRSICSDLCVLVPTLASTTRKSTIRRSGQISVSRSVLLRLSTQIVYGLSSDCRGNLTLFAHMSSSTSQRHFSLHVVVATWRTPTFLCILRRACSFLGFSWSSSRSRSSTLKSGSFGGHRRG